MRTRPPRAGAWGLRSAPALTSPAVPGAAGYDDEKPIAGNQLRYLFEHRARRVVSPVPVLEEHDELLASRVQCQERGERLLDREPERIALQVTRYTELRAVNGEQVQVQRNELFQLRADRPDAGKGAGEHIARWFADPQDRVQNLGERKIRHTPPSD